jgi:hypothetical protein
LYSLLPAYGNIYIISLFKIQVELYLPRLKAAHINIFVKFPADINAYFGVALGNWS